LKRSASRHIDLLNQLQELPRDKMDARLDYILEATEAKRKKGEPDFLAELERFVARFDAGLPTPMRNGRLETQYETALADIRREYETEMTAAATAQYRFPDPYPQWLEQKKAELAARKTVSTGNFAGRWELNTYRINADGNHESHGQVDLEERRCSAINLPTTGGEPRAICNEHNERCSIEFRDDMRFSLSIRGDGTNCEIAGNYEYQDEDTLAGKSDDGCFTMSVEPSYSLSRVPVISGRDLKFDFIAEHGYSCNQEYESHLYSDFELFMQPARE
jgi:hypothetical protein